MSKSHECQRAKVLQEKGEQWSEGGREKQGRHLPYHWAPGYMDHRRKTALMAVEKLSSENLHASQERS